MSQDKEYIPEWKQPHIGSEAKKSYVTFEYNMEIHSISKNEVTKIKVVPELGYNQYSLIISSFYNAESIKIKGNYDDLKELHQSILDQLNQ